MQNQNAVNRPTMHFGQLIKQSKVFVRRPGASRKFFASAERKMGDIIDTFIRKHQNAEFHQGTTVTLQPTVDHLGPMPVYGIRLQKPGAEAFLLPSECRSPERLLELVREFVVNPSFEFLKV